MSTLIFDLDGTLLDVRARHYAVYAGLLRETGAAPLPESIYWRRRRAGRPASELLPEPSPAAKEEFRRGWLDRIEQSEALSLDHLYPAAMTTLESLGQTHRMVLITLRHDREALEGQLKSVGLNGRFQQVISPPPGQNLTRKAGLWPRTSNGAETLVIGDSEADIELAAEIGAECICLTHGVRSARFLRERGADWLVNSLPALLRATRIDC